MPKHEISTDLPVPLFFAGKMMESWLDTVFAATDQALSFWISPFAAPPEEAHEAPEDLDIPGPFERDHESDLFA